MRKEFQNFLRKLIFKYMPKFLFKRLTSCETIAFQLSNPENLTLKEKLQIKFHLFFCHSCWVYLQQMKLIQKGTLKFFGKFYNLGTEQEEKIDKLSQKIIHSNCCKK